MKKPEISSRTIFLSLGSSQEFWDTNTQKFLSSSEILEQACKEIEPLGINFRVSRFIKSEPWGGVAQNIFVNAVCRIEISETILQEKYPENSEEKFLDILQAIEKKFGRIRDENSKHWSDRTLDIDILFWGNAEISRPRLKIPHPYIWERDFVYEPLQEICSKEELENLKAI